MSNWPLLDGARLESVGADLSDSKAITVFADPSTIDTKGAYSEITASTSFPWQGFWLCWVGNGQDRPYLVDVAVGASGSESIILEDYYVPGQTPLNEAGTVYWPLAIPAASRVAVRLQTDELTFSNLDVALIGIEGGWNFPPGFSKAVAFGQNLSIGTDVDPGSTVHTKGSWTELVASTNNNFAGIRFTIGNSDNAADAPSFGLIDFAVGAGGSEVITIENLLYTHDNVRDVVTNRDLMEVIPLQIPSGTRIAARCQASTTNDPDRKIDIVGHGFIQ